MFFRRKLFSFCCILIVLAVGANAFAAVDCATLKSKIDDGLKAKGVQSYTLTVVPTSDTTTQGKVVGTCDGGTQKIVYDRASAGKEKEAAPAVPKSSEKPSPAK